MVGLLIRRKIDMKTINMNTEVMVLKGYINYYNTHKDYTKEQLYRDYYDLNWEKFYNKGTLDKYLREVA
jgi:hypothetical protein